MNGLWAGTSAGTGAFRHGATVRRQDPMEGEMDRHHTSFELTDPAAFFRMALGALYVPHILFKVMGLNGAVAFFAKAGFQPAYFFVVLAIVMETVAALGLFFNVMIKWTGLLSAAVLGVAAYAVLVTKGVGWLWNLGGVEYIALWGFGSLCYALQAWKREVSEYGRFYLLNPA